LLSMTAWFTAAGPDSNIADRPSRAILRDRRHPHHVKSTPPVTNGSQELPTPSVDLLVGDLPRAAKSAEQAATATPCEAQQGQGELGTKESQEQHLDQVFPGRCGANHGALRRDRIRVGAGAIARWCRIGATPQKTPARRLHPASPIPGRKTALLTGDGGRVVAAAGPVGGTPPAAPRLGKGLTPAI
jgi:hypothetical protein